MIINKSDIITIAGGHIGNAGAVGVHDGVTYKEEVLTEKLVIRLCTMLKENGYNAKNVSPIGKFDKDQQLREEVRQANLYPGAKLHLCIHFNSSNALAYGVETMIQARGGQAEKYAPIITKAIADLGYYNRGVRVPKEYLGYDLYVCKNTIAPCVLLETCFIDNKCDIQSYDQEATAKALYKALTGEEYNLPHKPEEPGNGEEEGYYMRKYKNGSTIEKVYADSEFNNQIGSLDPWEECECIYETTGRAIVKYNVTGSTNWKTGWVSFVGGIVR